MRLKARLLIAIAAAALFTGSCGYEEPPQKAVVKAPAPAAAKPNEAAGKKEAERYSYKGDKYRDPFIPLAGEGLATVSSASDEISVPNLGSLALKGIFDDGKMKMALITGSGINYILKGSRLYDNRQRLVRGISGIIKKDSVIMIAPDKTTKELKIKSR